MLRADPPSFKFSLSLANAIILASDTPLLLLSANTTVLAASRSFCQSFGIEQARATSVPLSALGQGEWDVPQLDALLRATASGFAAVEGYEMDLHRRGHSVQRLRINVHEVDYVSEAGALVLLSAIDISETRRRDRQKDILLQELQHRTANSLQIIASVLLQSARTAQSEEARSRINEAHHRVMSVAALQHQLALSDLEEVNLSQYLVSLCRSIGTSMIRDPSLLTLKVEVPSIFVQANVSLSLGLIVTELVINALKHAFPGGRGGRIVVAYTLAGNRWILTVSDNGTGRPIKTGGAKAGLGSSIVTALAAQLGAVIVVSDANPGTTVSICHEANGSADARAVLAAV